MEEMMKCKMVIEGMHKSLEAAKPEELDIVKATKALRTLEERVEILKHLKNPPLKEDDKSLLEFEIKGTPRTLTVDIAKMLEAVTIQTDEEADTEEKEENKFKEIETTDQEKEFLDSKLKNFDVIESKTGALEKKCMLSLIKLVGDFAET